MLTHIRSLILIGSCFLSFTVGSVFAAVSGTLTSNPENPGPYTPTTLTFMSYSFDVDVSSYEWYIDGIQVESGIGKRKFTITTKAPGTVSSIRLKVTTPNNETIESAINLTPQDMQILWEAVDSYVPAGYLGRALPGEGGVVNITAFPQFSQGGVLIPPEKLTYSWLINDEYNGNLSGYGKFSNRLTLDTIEEVTRVRIIARSAQGDLAEKTIEITPHDTVPIFYFKDPLYGIYYGRAISGRVEISRESTLVFVPYFISNRFSDQVYFTWSLDGLPVSPTLPDEITVLPKEGAYGVRTLSVLAGNLRKSLQQATQDLQIVFDTR